MEQLLHTGKTTSYDYEGCINRDKESYIEDNHISNYVKVRRAKLNIYICKRKLKSIMFGLNFDFNLPIRELFVFMNGGICCCKYYWNL